jgi:hypothetical protein
MFTNTLLMTLHIAPNRLIADIQKDFSSYFPYLKLEFIKNNSHLPGNTGGREIIASNKKITEGQRVIASGEMEISGEMKVQEMEMILKEHFGLTAQVFRKSGNLWLETTMTDSWTLRQQNNHGCEISAPPANVEKKDDYDLTRGAD